MDAKAQQRREAEQWSREQLERHQCAKLNWLLSEILPSNTFYANKLAHAPHKLASLEPLASFPFTFKDELIGNDPPDVAANRTYPLEDYIRFHRTSGTRGRPLVVLDTADDWQWWIDTWQFVYDAADVGRADRVFLAFSFGPFIGFWSAHDAAVARGCLVIPGGGMSTTQRIDLLRSSRATVVCCTPSYALRMAEVAEEQEVDLRASDVRALIVAGEPGGSVPAIRHRIETAWGARVVDHSGATEVGPWGYASANDEGLHVIESEFIAEFLSVETGQPAGEGELSELLLTSLGRRGCPVIRYRTGDLVRPQWNHDEPSRFVLLPGGVLGRTDDMMIIRGVNVFPSAVEQILRGFPEVVEYRMTARREHEMDSLTIEVEDRLEQPERIAEELQLRLGLRVDVVSVPLGSLPRYEAKSRRFVDLRDES